ncbi:MAG: YicC family protein [Eubacteriales bacterium]|nr:YicC family protein [Eubacteriales bacterium]
MAFSMTGYGRGEQIENDRRVTVEMKSINNRFCDIQIRQSRVLAPLEARVRDVITRRLARGKIDVSISFEDNSESAYRVHCDIGLAKAYATALRQVSEAIGSSDTVTANQISRFSDVLRVESAQIEPEAIWVLLEKALDLAITNLMDMRAREGEKLVADIREKIIFLLERKALVAERAPNVPIEYQKRLSDRIDTLLTDQNRAFYDEQRLTAEVLVFADKCAIDEELVRLASHLHQLDLILGESGAIGKKIDFLLQEINREINTIGSKANDLELTQTVVEMKSELEKIREQIQNLE